MKRKFFAWGLLLSLTAHVVALAVASLYRSSDAGGNVAQEQTARPAAQQPAQMETPPIEDVLTQYQQIAAGLSDRQKTEALQGKLPRLAKIDRAGVEAIASLVEQVKGVDQARQYAPNPQATGKFDVQTACLHDITKELTDRGAFYEYTLVDEAGRTLKYKVAEKHMTPGDLLAFKVFEMCTGNAKLRTLVDTAIKVGYRQTVAEQGPAPPRR